jgi:hypothetical protein
MIRLLGVKLENDFVEGIIEEALADKMPPGRFPEWLKEALTAGVTYKRGNAPDLVAILNSKETLAEIIKNYESQYKDISNG